MMLKYTVQCLLIALLVFTCESESEPDSTTDLLESDFTTSIPFKSSEEPLGSIGDSAGDETPTRVTTEVSDPGGSSGSVGGVDEEEKVLSTVTISTTSAPVEREDVLTSEEEEGKVTDGPASREDKVEASVREPKSKHDTVSSSNSSRPVTSTESSLPKQKSSKKTTTTTTTTLASTSVTTPLAEDDNHSVGSEHDDSGHEMSESESSSHNKQTKPSPTSAPASSSDEDEEKPLSDDGGNHGHTNDDSSDHNHHSADEKTTTDDKHDTDSEDDSQPSAKPFHDKSEKGNGDESGHHKPPSDDNDGPSFDNFDDLDLENFTLPSFEVNPIVEELNNQSAFIEEVANASQAAALSPSGLQFGNFLYRVFQGPDRTKLPINAPTEDIYRYMASMFENETQVIAKQVLPYLIELGYKTNVEGKCSKAMMALSNGVKAKRTWAFKFLDSNGQANDDGLVTGSLASLGNFDQCVSINVADQAIAAEDRFSGHYCLAKIHPPLPKYKKGLTFSEPILNYEETELENTVYDYLGSFAHEFYSNPLALGLCVPSACSASDVAKVMNQIISQFNFTVTFDSRCVPETEYWKAPSPPEYAIFIFGLLGLMVLLGTAYDAYLRKSEENCLGRLFAAFSVIFNTRSLLGKVSVGNDVSSAKEEKIASEKRSLSWIHGLQVLALFWLITANVYQLGGLPITYIIKNLHQDFRSQGGSILFQFILNSWDYLAELFFLIGGFLFTNSMLALHERKKAPTFGKFVIRQWLHYAPSVIATILITLIVFQWSWSSGPLYSNAETLIVNQCVQNGASNIMLFSNWVSTKDMCLPHTWFLSALFQLQVISFLVVLLLHKKPSVGIAISLTMALIGVIVPGLITYTRDLPPTMLINNPNSNQTRADLSIQYFATYNHFSAYFIGILLGYFIFKRTLKPTMKRAVRFVVWIILAAISLSSILITCKWNGFEEVPNRISSTIYSSLHRVAFISLFAWLIHQFTTGQKGPVERVLSWSGFKILSRLSLQIYLIHLIIVWHYFLTKRSPVEYRNSELTTVAFGIILLSSIGGYFMHLLVEAPFHQITAGFVKCLFGCDLKSRLREFEEENDSQSNDPISEEKKNALQQQQQDNTDNGDIRINVTGPTEDEQLANNNGVVIRL